MLVIDRKTLYILAAVLAIVILACAVLGTVVYRHGAAIDQARANISAAVIAEQSANNRIGAVETRLGENAAAIAEISAGLGQAANSIATVKERINSSQNGLKEQSGLVSEGQSILTDIRKTGQSGDAKP